MDVQRRQRPGAIQGLKAGETLTDTLTVTNADGKTTTTVTITINGTDDAPTLSIDKGAVCLRRRACWRHYRYGRQQRYHRQSGRQRQDHGRRC
ncbi:hypothetical protein VI35_03935 [Aeromonas caviae]|nr:hypothetical protein VI35_03935 [Aeromonas caviae]